MIIINSKLNAAETNSEDESQQSDSNPIVSVLVVFTSTKRTLIALEKANELARNLHARIIVVAVQDVPFPLPLDQQPAPFEFAIRQFTSAISNIDNVHIIPYLCRDQYEAFKRILHRDCPAVIGIKKRRWWPTREERLAKKLQREGYKMILVETE